MCVLQWQRTNELAWLCREEFIDERERERERPKRQRDRQRERESTSFVQMLIIVQPPNGDSG